MAGAGPLISIHPNSWSCQHDDFAYFQGVPYGAGGRLMLRILPHPIGGTLNDLRTVANTPIQQGTTILVERPIFRIPNLSAENINAAVARLIPRNLFCFQGLCHRDRGEGVAITAKDRVDVNNHNAASESDPAKRMGVSLFYSRINHSCAPNVEHIWKPNWKSGSSEPGRMVLRTLVNIDFGQEINISYIGGDGNDWESRTARQQKLKAGYGFTCNCIRCSLAGDPKYDRLTERRRKLKATYTKLFGRDDAEDTPESHNRDVPDIYEGSWASEAGDYFLLAEEELNDFNGEDNHEHYGIDGYHNVDARLCRAALKAAKTFEDIADRFSDNGESFNAAVGRTWEAIFLAYAMIIGDVCYGPANEQGALDETIVDAMKQMRTCLKALVDTEFRCIFRNMIHIFKDTEAGEEFRTRLEYACLRTGRVVDEIKAFFDDENAKPEKDHEGDSTMDGEDETEKPVLKQLCETTCTEAMSEVAHAVITRYGFVVSEK